MIEAYSMVGSAYVSGPEHIRSAWEMAFEVGKIALVGAGGHVSRTASSCNPFPFWKGWLSVLQRLGQKFAQMGMFVIAKPNSLLISLFLKQKQQQESNPDPLHQASGTKCGYILKPDEVQMIWDNISSIIRPSWLISVPAQLDSISHRKLKAD